MSATPMPSPGPGGQEHRVTVQDALNRLKGVKKSGSGYIARCPAHDDTNPSLSIAKGDKGGVVLHCHAGCDFDAVAKAMGFKMSDLAPPGDFRLSPDGGIEATYEYVDENGEVLYHAVRLSPKTFRVRRPLSDGSFVWKLGDARRVPYRLPELIEAVASGNRVFVVEGEKDADRLSAVGLTASTNVFGAGKWDDSYNSYFRGAQVVILPDNDHTGRRHAEKVKRALRGVAEDVRVLELPDLPEKGDVSDWLDAGGTRDELLRLVESAPGDTWPSDPDLPETPKPENLPLECFPSSLQAQIGNVAEAVQISADVPALLSLLSLSIAVGGKFEIHVDDAWSSEWSVLYGVAILPSGERKSSTFSHMFAPIESWQAEKMREMGPRIRSAHADAALQEDRVVQARRKAVKNASLEPAYQAAVIRLEEARDNLPLSPRILLSDTTPEALVRQMETTGGRVAILSPEGGPFVMADGQYFKGQARIEEFKKAWSGESITTDRIGRDHVFVPRPALTLAVTIQPGVLEGLKNARKMRGEGLFARILFVRPDSMVGSRVPSGSAQPLDSTVCRQYERVLQTLLDASFELTHIPAISFDAEGLGVLDAFQAELEAEKNEGQRLAGIVDWAEKAHGQAARIAVLLALAQRAERGAALFDEPVELEWVQAAVKLVEALTTHALAVFGEIGAKKDLSTLDYVLRRIRKIGQRGEVTVRDLSRAVQGHSEVGADREALGKILGELEERACIAIESQPRRSALITLHPKLR